MNDDGNSNNTILPIQYRGLGKLYDYSFGTIIKKLGLLT